MGINFITEFCILKINIHYVPNERLPRSAAAEASIQLSLLAFTSWEDAAEAALDSAAALFAGLAG